MKTTVPCCATCASTSIVKAGYNGSGTQQYLCKACGAHRVLVAKSPATDPARKTLILRAMEVERLGLRAAERVFGVAWQTVSKCSKKSGQSPTVERHAASCREGRRAGVGRALEFRALQA